MKGVLKEKNVSLVDIGYQSSYSSISTAIQELDSPIKNVSNKKSSGKENKNENTLVYVGYMSSSSSIVTVNLNLDVDSPIKSNSNKKSVKGQTKAFKQNRKKSNMQIHHKNVSVLGKCNQSCDTKTSKDDRQVIWDEFRTLIENDDRAQYLSQVISIETPNRRKVSDLDRKSKRDMSVKYYLKPGIKDDDNRLCKSCFIKIYRLSNSKIHTLLKKMVANGQSSFISYNRGKNKPANAISNDDKEEASLFLLAVPSYESHYARKDTEKRYLPDYHTLTSLFMDFKLAYPNNRVHFQMFSTIFKDLKLSIKTKSIDTCQTCDKLKIALEAATSEEQQQEIRITQEKHWIKWEAAKNAKKFDANLAKIDSTKKVVAYDLQQILRTPTLSTSVAFYSRQLSTFNLTIFDLSNKTSTHNIWHEGIAQRGSNEINSCIYNYGINLPPEVRHLTKYSDRCFGQNLNINSIIADLYLLQTSHLEIIDSKYLVSGHTHMEVDSAHAIIERFKKKARGNIETPDEWCHLIGKASSLFTVNKMTSSNFLDFSTNLKNKLVYRKKNVNGDPWKFEDIYHYRVEKENPFIFKYKTSFEAEEPFKVVSLMRKSTKVKDINLVAEPKYDEAIGNPIPKEKKDDLIGLLKYISPKNRDFYNNLTTIS